jgi:phenylpyruvate tautomerase PptA (4-oxalocrotonate tautomerase family)
MPLWSIFHPAGTFKDEEAKRAFSTDITKLYTSKLGLPAFYVIVQFVQMPEGDVWMGGTSTKNRVKPFIRVVIEHTAVNAPTDQGEAAYKTTCQWVDEAMKPHVEDMGYEWEYHISENDRRLWKINGLIPPPWKSEAESEWVKADMALPWSGDH